MTVEAGKQLGRGIINSIITYFGADSMDILTPDGLPEESGNLTSTLLPFLLVEKGILQLADLILEE